MEKIKKLFFMLIASLFIFSFSLSTVDYNQAYAQSSGTESPVLISNESIDGNSSANTVTFDQKDRSNLIRSVEKSAHRLDYVKPFNPPVVKENMLQKSMLLRSVKQSEKLGASRTFQASNLVTNTYYPEKATLEYVGSHADVWVGDPQFTSADATRLGQEFDRIIYPLDVSNFGSAPNVDGSGKINILCFDIQDGFDPSNGYSDYDAGYFDPRDLFPNDPPYIENSNQTEIFYIDTNPSMGTGPTKDVTEAFSTLAHEFQHMINFNQKFLVQQHDPMDTWMNEGLSMAAEQIYAEQVNANAVLQDQIDDYNNDPDIADGHSLLYWDNSGDTIANYSLSYLFMEYLRIQCGQGNGIFRQLINDPHSNYVAVQDLIHKYIDPQMSFGKFMTDFRIALYLKRSTGRFGFHNEPGFQNIDPVVDTDDSSSVSLRSGGAIVKWMKLSSIPKTPQRNITYTNLADGRFNDTASPAIPKVYQVADNNTSVTGTAETRSVITVTSGSRQISIGNANSTGEYQVPIPTLKAGTLLEIYATDAAGNKSGAKSIKVIASSKPLSRSQVSIVNNRGADDRIYVNCLQKGDVIRLYNSQKHWLKTQTAKGSSTILYVHQLGSQSGNVYLSVTHPHLGTSNWTKVYFSGEISAALRSSQIKVYNYKHRYDQVRVYRIKKGDDIRVYNSRNRLIAQKISGGSSVTLYIRQLGRGKGHIYMTITHYHMRESSKTYAAFKGE
ncbi:Ig-like domain-containing protein [Sporolactobacillus pectinivorans]|uniref:Ig-like domain-containing protein n=1 Tax=Sporolactobacillus pectinivorans TaxID=1591408 RepID=UPI000C26609B|nr:Ig-like domain-containing protein [Sporolactobacillus pectinivorans]